MTPLVIKMRLAIFLFFFASIEAALFVEAPRVCDSSLREVLLESLALYTETLENAHKLAEESKLQLAKPFDRETNIYCFNSSSQASTDPVPSKNSSDMTFASWIESKQFRVGTKVECEMHFSSYKSPTTGPKALKAEGIAFRLHQPLLKEFRFGHLATQEKVIELQQKIDFLGAVHNFSQALIEPITLYWNLVFAKERVAIWEKTLKRFEEFYKDVRPKIVSGELSDVSYIILEMSFAKRSLLAAERELAFCKKDLEGFIGREVSLEDLDPFREVFEFNQRACLEKAFSYRKDLQALNTLEEGISLLILNKKNEKLPSVDLKLHYKIDEDWQNVHERGVEVSLSFPTYKERRNLGGEWMARSETLLNISSKKGEIAMEIEELFKEFKNEEFPIIYSLNGLAEAEEKLLRQKKTHAIWFGKLQIAMGTLLEVDFGREMVTLCVKDSVLAKD